MQSRYETLLNALKCESLTEVAHRSGYTQSGITHLLNSIEKEWELTLLIRSKKKNTLTPEGKELLPYLQDLVNTEHTLKEKIASLKGNESGLVRIGSITSVSSSLLPKLLSDFSVTHPGIRFEIDHLSYEEIEKALLDETIDLGFLQNRTSDSKINCMPFYSDEAVAVLPGNFFEIHPTYDSTASISPEVFSLHPLIMVGIHRGDFHRYLDEQGVKTTIPYTAQEDELAATLIEQHLGIGMGYRLSLAHTHLKILLKPLSVPLKREIVLATKQSAHQSLALQSFLAFVATTRKETNNFKMLTL